MEPVPIGKHFGGAVPGNTVVQIVAAADNVGGVIIRTLRSDPFGGAVILYASKTAPVSHADPLAQPVFVANGTTGTSVEAVAPYPLLVPPGYGLWATSNTSVGSMSMSWDFLS